MTQQSVSPSAVLNRVATEFDSGEEKVELSDEDMAALGIWTDGYGADRVASVRSDRDGIPVSYRLYNVSDIEGHGRGEYLALEVHDKQQGERYTRPYAIGLGTPAFTPVGLPDATAAEEAVTEVAERRNVEAPTRDQVAEICAWFREAAEIEVEHALAEGAWAVGFNGSDLWVEPEVRWQGFSHEADRIGLSEEQRRVVKEADVWWPDRPRSLDVTTGFAFRCEVAFERGED